MAERAPNLSPRLTRTVTTLTALVMSDSRARDPHADTRMSYSLVDRDHGVTAYVAASNGRERFVLRGSVPARRGTGRIAVRAVLEPSGAGSANADYPTDVAMIVVTQISHRKLLGLFAVGLPEEVPLYNSKADGEVPPAALDALKDMQDVMVMMLGQPEVEQLEATTSADLRARVTT